MAAPAALALALVLAAPDTALQLGVRAEERTRSLFPETTAAATFLSLQATPRAAFSVNGSDLLLSATYAPDLREPDLLTGASLQIMHRAEMRLRTAAAEPWQLSASAAGAFGSIDFLAETQREAASPQPIPTLGTIRYQEASGTLAATVALDRRTRAAISARAYVSGGTDREARAIVPFERGLETEGSVAWNATRGDVLTARLGARAASIVPSDDRAAFAIASGSWRHRFEPAWEGWAGAGISAAWSEFTGRSTVRELLPAGDAGLTFATTRPARVEAALAASAAPFIDRYAGRVDERIEVSTTAAWHASSAWALTARGAGAMFLHRGLQRSIWSTASLGISWTATRGLVLTAGAIGQWQRSDVPLGLPGFTEYGTFLAGSYESERL